MTQFLPALWSEWTNDGVCSKSCDNGKQKMKRTCKIGQDEVDNWYDYCPSDQFENEKIIACNQQVCRKFSSLNKSQKFRLRTLLDVNHIQYMILHRPSQSGTV